MSRSRSSSFVRTPGFQPKASDPKNDRLIDPFGIPAPPLVTPTPESNPDQDPTVRTPQEILEERRNSPMHGLINPRTKGL